MSNDEILAKLKEIVSEKLGVSEENITEDATFVDDFAADSLDIVEVVMAIEDEFEIEIPDSEAEKIITIRDVIDYIQKK